MAELVAGARVDLAELAQAHTQAALDTLVDGLEADGKDGPAWPSRLKAANSILDYGHGRPDTRETKKESGGLTVVINMLGDGSQLEKVVSATELARNVKKASVIEAEATVVDTGMEIPQESV